MAAIHSRFMTPPKKSKPISAQQQPRQKAPGEMDAVYGESPQLHHLTPLLPAYYPITQKHPGPVFEPWVRMGCGNHTLIPMADNPLQAYHCAQLPCTAEGKT